VALTWVDIGLIVVWLTVTLGAGMLAGARTSVSGFWVSDRSARVLPLILSVVSTQVGAGAIIGIASATWAAGIGFGLVSLVSTVVGFLLVARLAPVLKAFGDHYQAITLPDLLRVRYGRATQLVSAVIILFTYLSLLAAQFLATSTLIAMSSGTPLEIAVVFAVVGVIVYSAFAGIRGDIVTDTWHCLGMGAVLFLLLCPALVLRYPLGGWIREVPARIWNPVTFGGYAFLGLGLLFGAVIPLLQPELWMKVYASRSPREARRVMVFSAFSALGVIPFYLAAIFLGVLGHMRYQKLPSGDQLVFAQIVDVLRPGWMGLGVACILSVIISTANSLIVVLSATVCSDLLGRGKGSGSSLVGSRVMTALCGIAGAATALIIPDLVQLLLNAFYMLLVVAPALVGVFAWRRATSRGAFWSITLGGLSTLAFMFVSPKEAFLPGLIVSSVAFVLLSLFSKHSAGEEQEIAATLAEKVR
jgi:solute:Na+ symporter, SSS family